MTREERALRNLKQMCSDGRYLGSGSYIPLEVLEDFSTAIKALEQESSGDNVVSRDVVKEQMIMYGFHAPDMTVTEFVEDLPLVNPKEPTNKNDLGVDAVSRKAVINQIFYSTDNNGDVVLGSALRERIARLPSVTPHEPKIVSIAEIKYDKDKLKELVNKAVLTVTPQEPKCKDCKWWKDSDGEYRRGCGAESQCPINRREVFEGNGYCYLFEPQESEK